MGFLSVVLFTSAIASDGITRSGEWGPWEMDLRDGSCELQMRHRAVEPPFYPDILFRFHVPLQNWRNGRGDAAHSDYPHGKMVLWLYSYLPNVPKENAPLRRIESAVLDGKVVPRTRNEALNRSDDIHRTFELRSEDVMDVLKTFSNVPYLRGTVDLLLTLSNGEQVHKKVPPGHFFKTQAKMLSVCMQYGFIH